MKVLLFLIAFLACTARAENRNVLIDGGTDTTTIGNVGDRLKVQATASGTFGVTQSTSPWVTSRNWTLSSGTDSIAAVQSGTWTVQQGSAPWSVSQSGTWTAVVNNYKSTSYVQGTVTVGTSQVEAKVGGSRLSNRQHLLIFNGSSNTIYIGPTGVTTSMRPLFKSQQYDCDDCNLAVYMIAGSAGNSVIVEEKN